VIARRRCSVTAVEELLSYGVVSIASVRSGERVSGANAYSEILLSIGWG
jgi:hypothetical protein